MGRAGSGGEQGAELSVLLGGYSASGGRVVTGGVGSQVRRLLIPQRLSTAQIPHWDLWQSGPGCCQSGSIVITTISSARAGVPGPPHPLAPQGAQPCTVPQQGHCLPRRRANARRSMGSCELCLGRHKESTAAGHGVRHGERSGQGLVSPGSGAAMRSGASPGKQGRVDNQGPKVPGGETPITPIIDLCGSAPAPGAQPCLRPQTPQELCQAPSCPARGRSILRSATGVLGGSQCRDRASREGKPEMSEPAGQGRLCRWPGSRC